MRRQISGRSHLRAWTCYAALGFVAVTVTVFALTLEPLAERINAHDHSVKNARDLRVVFLGRGGGSLIGTLLGGWLCDKVQLKPLMCSCIVLSALSIALMPLVADRGCGGVILAFGLLGVSGSALVCCAYTTASWAFPAEQVGPINAGMAASYGIGCVMLPLLLYEAQGIQVKYVVAALCAVPAIALLVYSSALPQRTTKATMSSAKSDGQGSGILVLACIAGTAQFVVQGANAALINWLVTFGTMHLDVSPGGSSMLVSVMQGGVAIGTMASRTMMLHMDLLDLACIHMALAVAGIGVWIAVADSVAGTYLAMAWYGLIAGPTLSFPASLFNMYTAPSGFQLSLISLGANLGTSVAPFVVGALFQVFVAVLSLRAYTAFTADVRTLAHADCAAADALLLS